MIKNIMVRKSLGILIIMAVAIMLFAGCSGSNQHKYIIAYETPANSVTAAQIKDASNIIKDRFKALDYNNIVITQQGDTNLKVEVSGDELVKAQAELIGKRNEIKILGPDKSVIITSEDIIDSVAQQDPKTKENHVLIKFSPDGKNKFAAATAKYTGKPLTILLDDEIISEPIVQAAINDGQAVITGAMVDKDAKELAAILKMKTPLPCAFTLADMTQK